jgi:site-specific recombinase XerD
MLNLSRRHSSSKCGKTKKRDCTCPIWATGTLHGEKIRKSLGIRNWEAAQALVRGWEARQFGSLTVTQAFDRFMADCVARDLSSVSIQKYELLKREMVAKFGARSVDSISVEDLAKYREEWKLAPISSQKKIERMRSFFKFCAERKWTDENPAKILKAPKLKFSPTLPFSDDDVLKIRHAIEIYPDRPKGRREQVRAFILVLLHSGLRMTDAVCLTKDKISDGKLMLQTAKTGQAVWVPLPKECLDALAPLTFRPFYSGNCIPRSAVADWQRSIARLFKIAGISGHPHMFRATLAVRLLNSGASLENVAALLGNSARIVEKHYAPWVRSRQRSLEADVIRAFAG